MCGRASQSSPGPSTTGFVCHTVTRLSNDGAATAYVRWTVDGGGMPEWSPNGSTIFRVTAEEFTIPPGAQIDVDLYPTMTADQWSNVTGAATVIWKVEVRGQSLPRVVDTTCITWRIDHPTVDDARRRTRLGGRSASLVLGERLGALLRSTLTQQTTITAPVESDTSQTSGSRRSGTLRRGSGSGGYIVLTTWTRRR